MTPNFSGICRCGHAFKEHRNARYLGAGTSLHPASSPYIAEECTHYGPKRAGGLGPDRRVHCTRYIDKEVSFQPAESGTFSRLARGVAWLRYLGLVLKV